MKRSHQWMFLGWFLAVLFAVPVEQSGIEISRGRRPQFLDVFTVAPREANLRAYERQLEEASFCAQAVRPWIQYVWFALLGEAGEKVIAGREGWLFYKPDVRYLAEPYEGREAGEGEDDAFSAITDFQSQLARRGIRLLVLPVPGKPAVYPDKLTRRARGVGVRSHTLQLADRLRKSGIEVLNLFELFARLRGAEADSAAPYYLLRDTHWSGEGARLAAETVARRIRELGWIEPGTAEYIVRPRRVRRRSDIARMIRVPGIEEAFPPEEVLCEQVERGGEPYRDDPASPVLLLGDSFLRVYESDESRAAGFIAHLARALRMPLASIVNDGGASTLVRQELGRRPELLAGKRLVIWEFVERDLRYGTEGWKRVALPEGSVP